MAVSEAPQADAIARWQDLDGPALHRKKKGPQANARGPDGVNRTPVSELDHQGQVHQRLAAERRSRWVACRLPEVLRIAEVDNRVGRVEVERLQHVLHVPTQLSVPALVELEVLLRRDGSPPQRRSCSGVAAQVADAVVA